ncbi:MAG: hypothetical protein ICV68_06305 [Pyrinomonadaceae bacterium]|nr:hypothetical protein [Pyrinomonadaceae bacterium]
MHNCRKVEKQLVDLLFDSADAAQKRRLLTEIGGCAYCMGQYQSLSDTLFVFERTMKTALPPESYWPRYNETLRARLHAPVEAPLEEKPAHASLWRRMLAARLPIPVPVAAALVIGLVVSSVLALRRAPVSQTSLTPSSPSTAAVRIVEVPVVQKKVVTRVVYVEKKQAAERGQRALLPAVARTGGMTDSNAAGHKTEEETRFFTRANLKGFQPADDMNIRVLKRNNTNDK